MPAVHQAIPDLAAALNMILPKIARAARRDGRSCSAPIPLPLPPGVEERRRRTRG
jgi:hypothetical protein